MGHSTALQQKLEATTQFRKLRSIGESEVPQLKSGTRGERAPVQIIAPPVEADVLQAQAQVDEHGHERQASVERAREQVVVALPPVTPVPVDHVPRQEPGNDPRGVVDGGGRRHHAGGADEHGHVDEQDPALAREHPVREPHEEGRDGAAQEEPVDRRVGAEVAEDPARADEAPDDGRVVEHVVHGARPGAVGGEQLRAADVGDAVHEPPRRPDVHERRDQRPHHLRHEHGPRRDLHVVAQLEVLQEGQRLRHADVAVHLEAHVGDGTARVQC
uniref:Uncharacterized protein n=1 Tax=Zea mays TaxID=4577 RepID=A0A804R0Z9_MAIZE